MKVLSIFGTRPEAIKMAPLVKKIEQEKDLESIVCVTAQHREMLDQVLSLFDIKPDYDLNIMLKNQTLSQITARALQRLEEILIKEKPDIVLVHGDTTTTFVGALAAFYQKIKVGHVEAGLRTYNMYSPYPEEMNRTLTGRIAHFHFVPTMKNKQNLLKEGIKEENVFITGNTVIDALKSVVKDNYKFNNNAINKVDFDKNKIILVTCHRRENLGIYMENVFTAIKEIVHNNKDVEVIYPVHLNPKVREIATNILGHIDRVHLIEPLEYETFANLMAKSYLILTDSGGIQEEAPSLGKPVLVVRKETERPEAVEAGTVKVVGVEKDNIVIVANELLNDKERYNKMAYSQNPYGDGTASEKIIEAIRKEVKI